MIQRILSILLLGAILIGVATAVSHSIYKEADRKLETQEKIAASKNREVRLIREARAEYEKAKHEPVKPEPIEVRIVK